MAGKADKEDDIDNDIIITEEPETVIDAGDIDSSSEGEEKKPVVQKTKVAKKRGNNQDVRMKELWLDRKQAEDEANRQAQIAAQERAKNTQYEQITASALEENINTKRELLKEKMIRAQESQDAKAIGEITVELGKVEAQSAQIDRYKIENRVQPQQQQQEPHRQQQQSHQKEVSFDDFYESLPVAGKSWVDQNRDWYDPSSETFNPEMASDVTLYAQSLERNPGETPVGTRAYFNKINNYIKQNWSNDMQDEEEEESAPVAQRKQNYAAPVGNRSAQTPSPGARKEYKISQSEKEMALSLDMKDKQGNSLSDNDKIKRFIALRESVPSDGPISMKTLRKGV